MNRLQERLDFLIEKYSVSERPLLKDNGTAEIGGKDFPLLSHRYNRKFIELKNIANNGTLSGISVMRSARIVQKGADLCKELYREADLCRFILNTEISAVTAVSGGNTLNAVLTAQNGVVCTLETAETLPENEPAKEKHEIISQHGTACDIAVDSQLRQSSVYVLNETDKSCYTDVDYELYGLTEEEAATVRAAFIAARDDLSEFLRNEDRINTELVNSIKSAAKNFERIVLK